MEGVAYLTHRFLMHGPLWFLHRSHHVPHDGGCEWNDLFGLFFAVPSILLINAGVDATARGCCRSGLGMTAYGAIYVVFHDIVVHRRVRIRGVPQWTYLRRIIMAHLVHHKTHGKDGARVVRLPVRAAVGRARATTCQASWPRLLEQRRVGTRVPSGGRSGDLREVLVDRRRHGAHRLADLRVRRS